MLKMFAVLAAWSAAILAVPAMSASEPGARMALDRFTDGLVTLHATFEQTITGPDGAVESSGKGQVWLAKPGLFRWEYEGDFPEVIVADGRQVWMHDVVMEQVTVKPESSLAQDSPLTVLTDMSALDRQFNVRELGEHDDLKLLELTARAQDSEFERVILGLDESTLRLMIMEDAFGLRTELRFSDVERNPELEDRLFEFVPPAGADVIGEGDFPD